MAKAKITARNGYRCSPDGANIQHYAFDQEVDGIVAEWAVADGYAAPVIETKPAAEALETKPAEAPETKPARKARK